MFVGGRRVLKLAASSSTSVDLVDSAVVIDDDELGCLVDGEVVVSLNGGISASSTICIDTRVTRQAESLRLPTSLVPRPHPSLIARERVW